MWFAFLRALAWVTLALAVETLVLILGVRLLNLAWDSLAR